MAGFGSLWSTLFGKGNMEINAVQSMNGETPEALKSPSFDEDTTEILGEVLSDSRKEYLEDRAHSEMREDTAYQRAVEDMRKAGLNPYTIGSTPANSSASQVGAQTIASKLQVLGYILDLKNLDLKNRKITNDTITSILKILK